MQTRRIFDTVVDKSATPSTLAHTFRTKRKPPVVTDPVTPALSLNADRRPEVAQNVAECDTTSAPVQSPSGDTLPTVSVIRVERYQRQTSDDSLAVNAREDRPAVGVVPPAAAKLTTPKEPTRSYSDASKRRTWKAVVRMRSASVSRAPGDTSNGGGAGENDGEGRWLNALSRVSFSTLATPPSALQSELLQGTSNVAFGSVYFRGHIYRKAVHRGQPNGLHSCAVVHVKVRQQRYGSALVLKACTNGRQLVCTRGPRQRRFAAAHTVCSCVTSLS